MTDSNRKKRVLFLCTANSCRSQMAQGYLEAMGQGDYEVFSAGLEPRSIHPLAVEVMKEDGIDISENESTDLKEYLGRTRIDTVITVCSNADARCPTVWPGLSERMHWGFEDPVVFEGTNEEKLAKFREVRNRIKARITDWVSLKNS